MTRGSGWPSARLLRLPSMMRIVGGSVGRAAPSASKSRSVVKLKYPIEHSMRHELERHGKHLASHIVPFDCRQAQDARRHGRYGPEGQSTSATLVKKASGIHDTSKICTPMSCCQVSTTMFQGIAELIFV